MSDVQIEQLFGQAVRLHGAGRLADAEGLYRRILAANSRHADALHLLGVLASQVGRDEIAVDLIGKAIEIDGTIAEYHSNRGKALKSIGRFADAIASCEIALCLKPDLPEAHGNRGNALIEVGHAEDALVSYNAAIGIRPDFTEAFFDRGIALCRLGRAAEASASFEAASCLDPSHAGAFANRGNVAMDLGLVELALKCYLAAARARPDLAALHLNCGSALRLVGRLEDAIDSLTAAIRIEPGQAIIYSDRGNMLDESDRAEEAIASYKAALVLQPDYPAAFSNRGNAQRKLGRYIEALTSYDRALRLFPSFAEAHANRGSTLVDSGRAGDAATACAVAICLKPDFTEALSNRAAALTELNGLEQAVAACDAALRVSPDYAKAHFTRSIPLMLRGRLEEGLKDYEWRWHSGFEGLRERAFSAPRWRGEDLAGKTILLHAEQGLGDSLQFCRYAPLVAARGGRVVLEVPAPLFNIMSSLDGVSILVAAGSPLPKFDFHCPLLSLPFVFGTSLATIPSDTPYLSARPEQTLAWRKRLGAGRHVGIAWRGNPDHRNDRVRSIRMAEFERLLSAIPEALTVVSLQKEPTTQEAEALRKVPRLVDPSAELADFTETAALISALDLIISVDTSVAHLSGALARPTWVALSFVPDWRWMMDRDDSPWYPAARLFRQTRTGGWSNVLDRIAAELVTCF